MMITDAAGIAEIHVLSWQDTYRDQMPDEMLDSLDIEDRTGRWKDMLENPKGTWYGIVAAKDDKIIGWCTFGPSRDENTSEKIGEIQAIYVHPAFLGIGAGSLMMEEAKKQLKDLHFDSATLWVLSTNKKSRIWYEKKGWKVDGETKIDKRGDFELHETRYAINL